MGQFEEVIGYTALANFFPRDPQSQKYLVFYPQVSGNNARNYGSFESLAAFRDQKLEDKAFADYCLKPDDVRELIERLWSPSDSEVYFPVPFPCLGGSGALSTFDK